MTFDLSAEQIVFLVFVGVYTLAAAVWDFRLKKIPNALSLPMFFLGLVYQGVWNGWSGLGSAFLAFLIGFGTLFVLWLIGGGGGGDVKLMGALAVWLGFDLTVLVLIVSTFMVILITIAGSIISLFTKGFTASRKLAYATSSVEKKKGKWKVVGRSTEDKQKKRLVAYAIPVALATWMVMFWKINSI